MADVLFTDEFGVWWESLNEAEQISIDSSVELLERYGVAPGFPHTSSISSSAYSHMRELRIQHEGRPYRILDAFDPKRAALLLIGGDKTGNDRWYEVFVPVADRLYEEHLRELERNNFQWREISKNCETA